MPSTSGSQGPVCQRVPRYSRVTFQAWHAMARDRLCGPVSGDCRALCAVCAAGEAGVSTFQSKIERGSSFRPCYNFHSIFIQTLEPTTQPFINPSRDQKTDRSPASILTHHATSTTTVHSADDRSEIRHRNSDRSTEIESVVPTSKGS